MKEMTVIVHAIAEDGLPEVDRLTGRVAFIFDGCVVSGWPLDDVGHPGYWEGDSDVAHNVKFANVTHWLEFPVPLHTIEKGNTTP